jgi:hypothetical protein
MNRRPSLSEMRWPDDPEDAQLPLEWADSVTVKVLDWAWRGFDAVQEKYLNSLDLSLPPPEQLERNLTELHFLEIGLLWARETGGYASLQPSHESPELATRSSASAKPPAYDLGFVHIENRRWKWPIEAKVLPTAGAVGEYLKDVREKFIAGVAGPFVGEGAMIGYLQKGSPSEVFKNLESELGQSLLPSKDFESRHQRSSQHARTNAPLLRLHHLIMELFSRILT